jgi:hypothetical protein
MLGYFRLCKDTSGFVRVYQVMSGYFRLDRLFSVNTCYISLRQVRSVYVRLGHVISG